MTLPSTSCAHVACTCEVVAEGSYCSDPCSTGFGGSDLCGCPHAECENNSIAGDSVDELTGGDLGDLEGVSG